MADDKELVFEVNAGQILAKLHLGSKQMYANDKKVQFYNSGIVGKDDGTPEKPDDCMFDMKNKSGQYEVACSIIGFFLVRNISQQEVEKLKSKMIKPTSGAKASMDDDTLKKEKEKLQVRIDNLTDPKKMDNTAIYSEKKKFETGMRKMAFTYLSQYLSNFCGKENASKLKQEDLVQFYIEDSFDGKYDKYTIPSAEVEDAIQKANEELIQKTLDQIESEVTNIEDVNNFLKDNYEKTDKFFKDNMCINLKDLKIKLAFKTGFQVELETM